MSAATGNQFRVRQSCSQVLFSTPAEELTSGARIFPLSGGSDIQGELARSRRITALTEDVNLHLICRDRDVFSRTKADRFLRQDVPTLLTTVKLIRSVKGPPFNRRNRCTVEG